MQTLKSQKFLVVLLLIAVCCLGGFFLKNAIGIALEVNYSREGLENDVHFHDYYSAGDNIDQNGFASISVYGSRYELEDGDDEGDVRDKVSWVYIGGDARLDENRILYVGAWASAGIAYERRNDLRGDANAWIKFPHEPLIGHNPEEPGAVPVGRGHDNFMVEVSGGRTYNLNEPQQWGRVQASASMRALGGRIKIGYSARIRP